MKHLQQLLFLFVTITFLYSCQKQAIYVDEINESSWANIEVPENFFNYAKVPGVAYTNNTARLSSASTTQNGENPEPDNGDDPIILGQQLNNPYTIANMQQAYFQLYGNNAPVAVTHLYVRFKPLNSTQLSTLLDNQTLELQDYPMDYEVVQEGDYYQDPALGSEDIGWLYSAVPVSYTPPAGIQYEVIEQLHIPNNDLLLESMAESIAAGGMYESNVVGNTREITRKDGKSKKLIIPNLLLPPPPCETDPCASGCPGWGTPECSGSGGGGGGGGGTNDPKIPRGQIEVQDIRTCTTPIINVPVRQARVVCKRWFKIELTYTDDQGRFVSSKKFNNKVKVIVKTENNNARVSKIRGIRLWQILFPVKKRIGVFDQGAMANIPYLFSKPNPTSAHDKELPYWVAVTTHNSVIEFRQYSTEFNTGQPPAKLNIMVTNWGFQRGAGAAPMWNKCSSLYSDFSDFGEYIEFFIAVSTYVSQQNLFGVLKNQMDLIIGYAAANADYNCRLTSANIKSIAYHELGHAAHYALADCDYWQAYRTRISNELITTGFSDPYGDGTETNAGVVAVGEMWGNTCEYIYMNRHYGNGGANGAFPNGFTARLQGVDWQNIPGGLNAYLNAIENFNPTINQLFGSTVDPHQWIPQGLPYDLMDDRNDFNFNNNLPVDNVFGYNMQQCFNALQSDVRTIPAFRDRLLQQNGNNQAANVTDLFFRYGY